VTVGARKVRETGDCLSRIIEGVSHLNNVTDAIAASARTLASGLGEVNASMIQMDSVTQQNAAMVEESTAACVALASEAQQLSELISHFDTEGRGRARPESARAA
jgi:methyl-accepting chemotaxis protein